MFWFSGRPFFSEEKKTTPLAFTTLSQTLPLYYFTFLSSPSWKRGTRKYEESEGCADDVLFADCVRIDFTRVNKRVCGLVAKIIFLLTGRLCISKYIHSFAFNSISPNAFLVSCYKVKCHTMNKHTSGVNIVVRPKTFILFYDYI